MLVDTEKTPHVVISWPTRDGGIISLEADRQYQSPSEKTYLGRNLDCFVALGGTRLDRGVGHPAGAIVRVGFYKADTAKLFFESLADDASISVTLTNVHFNQPATPRRQTALQHLKYMTEDIIACGLGPQALDQFNTFSSTDTLRGRITSENGRLGALGGKSDHAGSVAVRREDDGSITMTASIPYPLLRHTRDPWLRTTPGGFFEPQHFHIEFEVLPDGVAAAEDAAGDGPAMVLTPEELAPVPAEDSILLFPPAVLADPKPAAPRQND